MSGLGSVGVRRVISMADRGGIMAGLLRASAGVSAKGWPTLEFVEQPVTHSPEDTTTATRAMVEAGVGSLVVLGGDGTNRLVASHSAETPLVSMSTGTNNAFPRPVEATVAGMAAGLVATSEGCRDAGTYRAKKLEVRAGDRLEQALVDVAISEDGSVGSGALWDVADLSELFLCFAEPGSIGLSAIGAHMQTSSRRSKTGLHLVLSPQSPTRVLAPIGPGLVSAVGVQSASVLEAGARQDPRSPRGVIAIDGERMVPFGPGNRPSVTLRTNGPVVVDVEATLHAASSEGLLRSVARGSPLDDNSNTRTKKQTAEPWEVST